MGLELVNFFTKDPNLIFLGGREGGVGGWRARGG